MCTAKRLSAQNIIALMLALALALGLGGCGDKRAAEPGVQKFSRSYYGAFDTITVITGYAESEAAFARAADGAFDLLMRYHRACDAYNAYDGLYNLNYLNARAAEAPVIVESELLELLIWAKQTQPLAQGRVNIALGALLMLWHDYREAGEALPPMDRLIELAEHSDIDSVYIDEANGAVYFSDPALKLDLGAVAKGYAVERAAQFLSAGDMPSFIINAGGNVRAGQKPMDGRASWIVGIQDPDGGAEYIGTLRINDMSAVTSGDYQRYYTVDGARYHHIIDPDTLMPGNYMRAITVLARDSALADLLSTALYLMPCARALEYAEALEGAEAYIIQNDGGVIMTGGMKDYI